MVVTSASADQSAHEEELLGEQHHHESELLLQQMKRCAVVHHQLSSLLIHSAALRAGVYGQQIGESNDDAPESGRDPASPLMQSIQNLGGSTARLFSMALHDQRSLDSASGAVLRERVDNIVEGMQSELATPGIDSQQIASDTLPGDAAGNIDTDQLDQLHAQLSRLRAGLMARATATEPERELAISQKPVPEVDVLRRDCDRLALELEAERQNQRHLEGVLSDLRTRAAERAEAVATECFDKVQRAEQRTETLEAILDELQSSSASRREAAIEAALAALNRDDRSASGQQGGLADSREALPKTAHALTASQESLMQLEGQVRISQSEFWGM